jgi:hypothetical protein
MIEWIRQYWWLLLGLAAAINYLFVLSKTPRACEHCGRESAGLGEVCPSCGLPRRGSLTRIRFQRILFIATVVAAVLIALINYATGRW